MKKVVFATYREQPRILPDDYLTRGPLSAHGITLMGGAWDDPSIRWLDYDAIVLRSTWNYHNQYEAFMLWLEHITETGVPIWNPPQLVRWNSDKRYLQDLHERGVSTVPTHFLEQRTKADFAALAEELGWDMLVVKPSIGVGSQGTFRVTSKQAGSQQRRIDAILRGCGALIQPLMEEIWTDGEWSLVFFRHWTGEVVYSHALHKRPPEGDIRVQTEHGGITQPATATAELIAQGQDILNLIDSDWLYARVDGFLRDGQLLLTELEMIEPSLYLQHDGDAPARFAAAIASVVS